MLANKNVTTIPLFSMSVENPIFDGFSVL